MEQNTWPSEDLEDAIQAETGTIFQELIDIMEATDAGQLKAALLEYFKESMHQSFDGHNVLHLPMYAELVQDISLSIPILTEEMIGGRKLMCMFNCGNEAVHLHGNLRLCSYCAVEQTWPTHESAQKYGIQTFRDDYELHQLDNGRWLVTARRG